MSVRAKKVAQEILELMADIIRNEFKDPRIDTLVTVTDVQVTNDLSYATIYVSKIASEEERQELLDILNKAAGFLRTSLSKKLRLRVVPELRFKLDDSLIYGEKIERIISSIHKGNNDE